MTPDGFPYPPLVALLIDGLHQKLHRDAREQRGDQVAEGRR